MAFQTGSQINPALGAINYAPYMQGAVAGAQSLGQGIANLGQSIGSGIEQYYKKKDERSKEDQATAFVGNLVKSDPQVAKVLGLQPSETGEYDEKALRAGVKAVGAPALLSLVNNLQMLQQEQAKEQAVRQLAIESNKAFGDIVTQFTDKNGKFDLAGAANAAAQKGLPPKAVLDYAETSSKIAAAGVQKQPKLSFPEQRVQAEKDAFSIRTGRQPNEQEMAQIMEKVASGSVPQPANPFLPEVAKQLFTLDQAAKTAPRQIERINQQIDLLDKGNVNVGFAGEIKQGMDKVLALFGSKDAGKSVSDTELLESAIGSDLLNAIKNQGLTTRSFDTPAEMKNLRAALTGGKENSPEVLKQLALLRKKNLEMLVEERNNLVKSGAYNQLYDLYKQPPSEIQLPASAPYSAPTPADGSGKNIVVDY